MVNIRLIDRQSNALTPSSLRCLSHLPTINMAAGCAHGCAYCYIRGYPNYPGDNTVTVYRNTAEQVASELKRRRTRNKPAAVYFCPSSDAFMPVKDVLDQSYRTMETLLDHGVGVQFVTKGAIPDRFFTLFARHPGLVAGQVGLTTLNEKLNAELEPNAAPAPGTARLDTLKRLLDIGVDASLRADPLIHRVTDDDANLNTLFAEASKRGVRDVSVSYLFLRPAIRKSLQRTIRDPDLLQRILAPFENQPRASFCTRESGHGGVTLPTELRRREFDRIRRIAERCSLTLRICGCKNADITTGMCRLTHPAATPGVGAQHDCDQLSLW
jgi:DNA repair photolyase